MGNGRATLTFDGRQSVRPSVRLIDDVTAMIKTSVNGEGGEEKG